MRSGFKGVSKVHTYFKIFEKYLYRSKLDFFLYLFDFVALLSKKYIFIKSLTEGNSFEG